MFTLTHKISVDGGWTQWLDQNPCNVSCGGGTKNQVRFCINPTPSAHGSDCPGISNQEVNCGNDACPTLGGGDGIPSVDGAWTDWADSSPCSASCGNGTKGQVRYCANPTQQGSGMDCDGPSEQDAPCNNGPCITSGIVTAAQLFKQMLSDLFSFVVDGGWTEWSDATTCSVTCGNGEKEQIRYCANPAPQGTGMDCIGSSEQTTACNIAECPDSGKKKLVNMKTCCHMIFSSNSRWWLDTMAGHISLFCDLQWRNQGSGEVLCKSCASEHWSMVLWTVSADNKLQHKLLSRYVIVKGRETFQHLSNFSPLQ